MTINGVRYVHTNLIATDWRALAQFYEHVFGCVPIAPERDLSGTELEGGTGIRGAALAGVHLRMPGHGDNGPTLEIFTYREALDRPPPAVNRRGLGHLAFKVSNVEQARREVLQRGGSAVGEVVTTAIDAERTVTWCYVMDPEGNVLELQCC